MTETEYELRTRLVARMLAGTSDNPAESRIEAITDLTLGIPWYVPPPPGEAPTRTLLFAHAVQAASLAATYGAPGPGHIMEAAIELAGRTVSSQGHSSMRRWVVAARFKSLGAGPVELLSVPLPALDVEAGSE